MSKILAFLLFPVFAFASSKVPFRITYFELPPHGFLVNSRPGGAAVEYVKLVMEEMNLRYKIDQKPLTRIIQNPEDDLVLFLGRDETREKLFYFNESPLLEMRGVLAVHKNSPLLAIQSYDDISGKTIGVWADGYRSPDFLKSKVKEFRFFGSDVIKRGLEVVRAKRIDAFYCPDAEAILYIFAKESKLSNDLRLIYLPEQPTGLYPALSRKTSPQLQQAFTEAFKKMQKKRPYSDFLTSYIKKAN